MCDANGWCAGVVIGKLHLATFSACVLRLAHPRNVSRIEVAVRGLGCMRGQFSIEGGRQLQRERDTIEGGQQEAMLLSAKTNIFDCSDEKRISGVNDSGSIGICPISVGRGGSRCLSQHQSRSSPIGCAAFSALLHSSCANWLLFDSGVGH